MAQADDGLSRLTISRSGTVAWTQARRRLAAAIIGWLVSTLPLTPANAAEEGTPILPGAAECDHPFPPDGDWTKPEEWAWNERICLGKIADMSKYEGDNVSSCDPKEADDWPAARDLSAAFLETILNHEPYRGALTRTGVRIRCARFNETLNLSHMVIAHPLWLDASLFRRDVNLPHLRSSSVISLQGSVFDGRFDAEGLDVAGSLFIRGGAQFKEVRLPGAKVGGQLSAIGSIFDGRFDADGLEVAGNLFMSGGAQFKGVRLVGAKVGGLLSAIGSTFDGLFQED